MPMIQGFVKVALEIVQLTVIDLTEPPIVQTGRFDHDFNPVIVAVQPGTLMPIRKMFKLMRGREIKTFRDCKHRLIFCAKTSVNQG